MEEEAGRKAYYQREAGDGISMANGREAGSEGQ